jgi:hypothetical protein
MTRNLILLAMVFIVFNAFGQKVTVGKKTEKVRNENADGYMTDLDAKSDDVRLALTKFLKDAGKSKNNGDMIVVNAPVINATPYGKGVLYASVSGSDVKSRVWIGILGTEWNPSDVETVLKDIEQMTYRFGIKYYRDKIQLQIDEGQQAADAVTKQTQRTVNEGESLAKKLKANDEEKIRLEKALEANKLEDLVLKQKIVNNKKSLDSLGMVAGKIKTVIDGHKERQGKVN